MKRDVRVAQLPLERLARPGIRERLELESRRWRPAERRRSRARSHALHLRPARSRASSASGRRTYSGTRACGRTPPSTARSRRFQQSRRRASGTSDADDRPGAKPLLDQRLDSGRRRSRTNRIGVRLRELGRPRVERRSWRERRGFAEQLPSPEKTARRTLPLGARRSMSRPASPAARACQASASNVETGTTGLPLRAPALDRRDADAKPSERSGADRDGEEIDVVKRDAPVVEHRHQLTRQLLAVRTRRIAGAHEWSRDRRAAAPRCRRPRTYPAPESARQAISHQLSAVS